MLKSSASRRCSILVIAAFFFMIIGWPYDSNADVTRWNRKDLPSTDWTEIVAIAAVVAVFVIVAIASGGKKKESDKDKEKEKENDDGGEKAMILDSSQSSYANYHGLTNSEPDGVSLSFYVGVSNNDFNHIDTERFDFNLSNQSVVVGVRLEF